LKALNNPLSSQVLSLSKPSKKDFEEVNQNPLFRNQLVLYIIYLTGEAKTIYIHKLIKEK